MKSVSDVVKMLMDAKEAYYNDSPIMTDKEFDDLEDYLRRLDPENSYFEVVGIPAKGDKISHSVPMLSMGKAKTIEDVEKWIYKIDAKADDIIIEPKIDGLSASIVYENGKLLYIATRGDGKEGQDVSHIAQYINVPKSIPVKRRVEVRGELFIPKDSKIPNPDNKPLRNIAVGLVNRKTERESLKYLQFIAYQYIGESFPSESSKIDYLSTIGFSVVNFKIASSIDEIEEAYEEYISFLRNDWVFDTDGLTLVINDSTLHETIDSKYVVDHHHHYAIALKPESQTAESVLRRIEWQISKQGNLIPVAIFDPVKILNRDIKKASLSNLSIVENMKLHIGDKLSVALANDVIPNVENNLTDHSDFDDSIVPESCPFCSCMTERKGVHLCCTNLECHERVIQEITAWAKDCSMEYVSEQTIRLLYNENKMRSVIDLYKLTTENLEGLEGIGSSKIKNIIAQIEKSKKMSIQEFISRLNIYLVGEKVVKKLKINSVEEFWKFNDSSSAVGRNIIEFRDSHTQYIKTLLNCLDVSDMIKKETTMKGKVCMTGKGNKTRLELIKDIEAKGYEFVDSITKDTNILICEDVNSGTVKLQKAQKMGIKLMSYNEFFK